MAGPRTRCNPLSAGKDKLATGAPSKGSGIPNPTLAAFCTPIPALTQDPAPAPGPPGIYTDVDLQKTTRLALELFVKGQEYGQANSGPKEIALKACNPDLYYESLHMECYYFCRQCKDYFNMAGATGHQRIPFAALFL